MFNFKTLLASASAVALLTAPLAVQASDSSETRAGTPGEEILKVDEDTVLKSGTEVAEDGNMRTGVAAEDANYAAAGDSPFKLGTTDSLAAEIAGATADANNAYVGNWVKSSDGANIGQISEVLVKPDGMQTAVVELDDTLGLDTDKFLISMGMQTSVDADVVLAQNKVEFLNEVAEIVGTTTGGDKN